MCLVTDATDKEVIEAYKKSSNYSDLARLIGYKNNISKSVRNKLKSRLTTLDLDHFNYKPPIDNKTKGQLFEERKNWRSARSAIQKHARTVYVKSGKAQECEICGYKHHFDVAHIKAVKDFLDEATIDEINKIDNLVALCPNHHWEFDNGILKLEIKNSFL